MTRNTYPGTCYRCGRTVAAGAGHFERYGRAWRVQHAECAIQFRGTNVGVERGVSVPQHVKRARQVQKWMRTAETTGRKAQRARKNIRDIIMRPVTSEPGQ